MQVFQCNLYPVLPEKIIYQSVVSFVEDMVGKRVGFLLKSAKKGTDPALGDWLVGYNPGYEHPYMSDLQNQRGLITIDTLNQRLTYDPLGEHFSQHRDSVAYIYPNVQYVYGNYEDMISAFRKNLYSFKAI